jgi:hypothetical protein
VNLKSIALAGAAALALTSLQASASSFTLNFDQIGIGQQVGNFYNGDFVGADFGVSFNDFYTVSGFGETSQPNLAYSAGSTGIIDVFGGFRGVSFAYGNFSSTTYNVWSGLDGTGTLLGSTTLTGTPLAFSLGSVAFSGEAHSLVMLGGAGQMGIDDLTLSTTAAVPEPASVGLMLAGLALVGATVRRRKA